MGRKLVVLKEPRRDRAWNIYALREAARLKKFFEGVYYSPELGRLLAVFRVTPGTHVNRLVFEEVGESVVKRSYKLLCPEGCARCCVFNSGAFILDYEVERLPDEELQLRVMKQPSEVVRTPGGPIRIYNLATGTLGRCKFLDWRSGKCIFEEKLGREHKPMICLLTYCTVFAERNGKLYLKTGVRRLPDGRVLIRYREVSEDEFREAVRRMAKPLEKFRRVAPEVIRREEEAEATSEEEVGGRRLSRREKMSLRTKLLGHYWEGY